MNKAQKLLQPLIDAAREEYNKTSRGGLEYDHEDMAERALLTLEEASAALAILTDAITLADVPAVEWDFKPANENHNENNNDHYTHEKWLVYPSRDANGIISSHGASLAGGSPYYWTTKDQARRYVEIRIHLVAIERKLLAELAGGK